MMLFGNQSLVALWTAGSLSLFGLHALVYLVSGVVTFKICARYARRQGLLGQY
ncbi:MAG TPA: hypothetical protein VFN35_35815 [Ktedonobacteraceae bacterium]|nr:hypothetical protein [Ktedonobacteraceae bacterium]